MLGKPHSLTPADIMKLANQTERYTCCDLANVFSKAGFHAVRELGAFEDMNDLDPDDVSFFYAMAAGFNFLIVCFRFAHLISRTSVKL